MNYFSRLKEITALILFYALAGCGGGGGTGAAAVTAAATQTVTNRTGDADSVVVTLSGGNITGFSTVAVSNTATSTITQEISDSSISSFTLTNVDGTASFGPGDTIVQRTVNGITVFGGESADAKAAAIALPNSGFAVYLKNSSPTSGFGAGTYFGKSGAISAFNPTGTVTYTGGSLGLYGVTGFAPVVTAADMTAVANFGTNAVVFSTTNTIGVDLTDGSSLGSYAALNIGAANLTYHAGDPTNYWYGNITDGAGNTGSAEIALFGAGGEELTGIGSLTDNAGAPTKVHIIAFGSN